MFYENIFPCRAAGYTAFRLWQHFRTQMEMCSRKALVEYRKTYETVFVIIILEILHIYIEIPLYKLLFG